MRYIYQSNNNNYCYTTVNIRKNVGETTCGQKSHRHEAENLSRRIVCVIRKCVHALTLRDAFLTLVNSSMSSNRNMYMSTAFDISVFHQQQHNTLQSAFVTAQSFSRC